MKKFYLLAVAALFTFQANAQTFSYTPGQTLHTELTTNVFSFAQISFSTNPVGAITFGWELISNDIPVGWSYSICDYTNCYPGIPPGSSMTPISGTEATNGTMGFLKITLGGFEVEGSATVEIYVYDMSDYSIGDTITFTYNHTSSLGLAGQELAGLSVFPNPAEDMITFNNIHADMGQIQVINALGAVVYSMTYTGSSMETIDIADFESGIYFVTYFNGEGIRETQKLIVK